MFIKKTLHEGVNVYFRKSDQFKTVHIAVKWKNRLTEQQAAARTVLANVLEDSNAQYTTQSDLRKALDDLYGTLLYFDVSKRSDTHIVSLYAECVNDSYLSEKGVFNQVLQLIHKVIFQPKMNNGLFDENIVQREKRMVQERIRSIYDDKTRYAQKRMLERIRPDHPASMSAYGTENAIMQLSNEDLIQAYEAMLSNDAIDIYIIGDVDESNLMQTLSSLFPFDDRVAPSYKETHPNSVTNLDVQHVRERQEMKQGKLHLAFRTPITFTHPDYAKMQVTNGVFGGFAHSKLFINVREKESMAYTVASSYASHYGLVYVLAGIDALLEEKAVALIQQQLANLQQGEITEREMQQTVALLTNSLKSTFDSARGQIEVFDQYKERNDHFSAESLINQWQQVTIQDVQQMASTLELEIIYLLSGREASSNEEN